LKGLHLHFEIEEWSEILEKKLYDGLKSCIFSLEQCHNLPLSKDSIIKELQNCFHSVKNKQHFAQLGQSLLQEISWKKQLGISDECMQSLYEGARALFEGKEFNQAEKAFFVVCTIDPSQYAYWIGLGHASFQIRDYQQAILSYSMASAIDSENIWPHIWAANCFEEENDFHYAKVALNEALTLQRSKMPKNLDIIKSLEERIQKIQI
jgi:tetratricopeptide (TPR) repeat protein